MNAFVQELESSPWEAFWPAGSGGGAGEMGGRRNLQGAWPLPWSPVSLRLDGVGIQERLDEELGGLVQTGKVGQHWDSFCSGRDTLL